MATILEQIVQAKKAELREQESKIPISSLEDRVKDLSLPLNLSGRSWEIGSA